MICEIEGCENPTKYRNMCSMHYKRWWRHGNAITTLTPTRGFQRVKCQAEDDCDNLSDYSCGLCEAHYQMQRIYGRTKRIMNYKGNGTIDNQGYVLLSVDGRRVHEHVLLAEKALGKRLPKGAVVHHMNRDRKDNHTPYNLVVCPSQDYHLLLHRRMKELGL